MSAVLSTQPAGLPPALLPALLDQLPSGVVYYQPVRDAAGSVVDFTFAYLNAAAQRLWQLPAQPPRTYLGQWPAAGPASLFAWHRAALLTGAVAPATDPAGPWQLHAVPLDGGLLVNFTPAAAPAAERPALLADQQRVVEDLFNFFYQVPFGVSVVRGPHLVVELLNDEAAAIVGRPREQVLGKPLFEVLPSIRDNGLEPLFQRVYQGETFVFDEAPVTWHPSRPDRPPLSYLRITYQPWRDARNEVIGMVTIAVEVTDQVLARQQVQQLNEELAAINEELTATNEELLATNEELLESNAQVRRTNIELDTFVYTASHDLKAPISNIESITLALRDTLPAAVQQDEMVAHLLDLLTQTTARFQFTIGQLTDLSKLQLAHAGPAEPVRLAAVIEAVRLDLAPLITAGAVQLTVEVAPELVVSFSPANLRSAIYNLLSNAIKYRALDRPAQVWVRAWRTGPQVTVLVQDNGLGLNAHQQARLFGLFQRLHTHVEGTGVGLYITKRLVENGGGTIAVASQVDQGTTLTLTFPV